MILYYAVISFCLTNCHSIENMERLIYKDSLSYDECLVKLEEMTQFIREEIPDIKHRPISQLCTREDLLKNKDDYKSF